MGHNDNLTISANATLQQFEALAGGHKAVLAYHLESESIVFTHTGVPEPIEGRGIGSALAKAGLDYAATRDLKVIPLCPFVEHYIREHPEHLHQVEPTFRERVFGLQES